MAENVRTPRWIVGAALHAAAGIAIAVVAIDLMPRILFSTPIWLVTCMFSLGACISLGLSLLVSNIAWIGTGRAWMVFVAVGADLVSDGLATGVGTAVAGGLGLLIAVSQSVANVPGGFAATANFQHAGISRTRRILVAGSLVVPVIVSATLGFWLLRDTSLLVQNAALSVIVGVLLVATVEDVIPEADASPRLPRWISTVAFAGGFVALALLSVYLK